MVQEMAGVPGARLRRLAWFAFFGLLAFLVNLALFDLLLRAGTPVLAAGVFSALVAMLLNFFPNDAVTWRRERNGPALRRVARFCASSLVGIAVNAAVLAGPASLVRLDPLLADIVGIGLGTACKFVLSDRWTWASPRDSRALTPPARPPATPTAALRAEDSCATLLPSQTIEPEADPMGKHSIGPARSRPVFGFLFARSRRRRAPAGAVQARVAPGGQGGGAASELDRLAAQLSAQDRQFVGRFIAFLAMERAGSGGDLASGPDVYGQVAAASDPVLLGQPTSVIVGPCAGIASIERLVDQLDAAPGFDVRFRAYQGGFYRLDGQALDPSALAQWVSTQPGVECVAVDDETLHVVPVEKPA